MRKRFVQINGELIEVSEDYVPDPVSPLVMPDIKPYKSMLDGSEITSRSRHREHLRAHGVVEIGNEKFPQRVIRPPEGLKQRIAQIANERLRHK